MTLKRFRGFSTYEAERSRTWARFDIDLIKRDLLNHFMTRVGERVMRPTFGCRIWDLFMEPMTPGVKDQIIAEARRICEEDPRVSLMNINVLEYESGIRIEIVLNYVGSQMVDSFQVEFENAQSDVGLGGSFD